MLAVCKSSNTRVVLWTRFSAVLWWKSRRCRLTFRCALASCFTALRRRLLPCLQRATRRCSAKFAPPCGSRPGYDMSPLVRVPNDSRPRSIPVSWPVGAMAALDLGTRDTGVPAIGLLADRDRLGRALSGRHQRRRPADLRQGQEPLSTWRRCPIADR